MTKRLDTKRLDAAAAAQRSAYFASILAEERKVKPPQPARRSAARQDRVISTWSRNTGPTIWQRQLHTRCVIHVLGKTAGRALCGAELVAAPVNPILTDDTYALDTEHALSGLPDAMAAFARTFPGWAAPCEGCLQNAARAKKKAARANSKGANK